jgi:ubiquinone/menaquinone biosynthesis C-methylase UbiE
VKTTTPTTATSDDALGIEVQPDDDYFDLMAEVAATHWWYRARREWMADELRNRVPKGGVSIDVGTGTAESLLVLRDLGAASTVGTDLSMLALRHARTVSPPPPVLSCLAERLPFADESADLLISTEVIEHLDDDVAALREYKRVLRPGASIFITTSSYMFLWSEHDVRAAHRRRYLLHELGERFEEAGLVVDRLSYYYSFLVPPAVLVRKTPLKRFVKETDEETSTMHPAIDAVFYRLATLERLLSRKGITIPFGLSMFCVAHKPVSERRKEA